jgi:hypothetical protein
MAATGNTATVLAGSVSKSVQDKSCQWWGNAITGSPIQGRSRQLVVLGVALKATPSTPIGHFSSPAGRPVRAAATKITFLTSWFADHLRHGDRDLPDHLQHDDRPAQRRSRVAQLFQDDKAGSLATLWRLRIPGALPFFLAGLRISSGCWWAR